MSDSEDPVSNLQLFSLKYIEDYWRLGNWKLGRDKTKLSCLVCSCVHTADTDETRQSCPCWRCERAITNDCQPVSAVQGGRRWGHWVTSLFGLVFHWVFSLSPKTNLTPEFWSQSEVRISWAKTGATIATEYTSVVDFRLTRSMFTLYLLFCTSLSIALKRVLRKKWRNRQKESY